MDFNESPDPQQHQQQQQSQQLFHQTNNSIADDEDIEFELNVNNQQNNEIEIDSSLLQQFSCLGTTDHEDLITELVKIMNNQISRENAKFFLEMSNWNLHAAIGCYMDLFDYSNTPSMKIVGQKQLSDCKQVWQLQNDGNEAWPSGCYLMSPDQTKRIEVPIVQPGDTCDILAEIPPSSPPMYWKLCIPNGRFFGDTIWMIPTNNATYDLAQRMSQLCTSTPQSPPTTTTIPAEINIQIVKLSKMFDC